MHLQQHPAALPITPQLMNIRIIIDHTPSSSCPHPHQHGIYPPNTQAPSYLHPHSHLHVGSRSTWARRSVRLLRSPWILSPMVPALHFLNRSSSSRSRVPSSQLSSHYGPSFCISKVFTSSVNQPALQSELSSVHLSCRNLTQTAHSPHSSSIKPRNHIGLPV